MNELIPKLESILFVASKPVTTHQLANILGVSQELTLTALQELATLRKDSGIVLMEANGQWQLGTHPKNVDQVKAFLTADLREKLTDATVEVLGIIAYRQPISKAEIEAIRGVNCQYSIRQLLMRGLIEKIQNPDDSRSNLYQVTTEFLQHMGMQSVADLPEFQKLTESIKLPETPQTKAEAPDAPASITEPHASPAPATHSFQDPVGGPMYQEPTPYAQPLATSNEPPTEDIWAEPQATTAPIASNEVPTSEEDEFIDDDDEEDEEEA